MCLAWISICKIQNCRHVSTEVCLKVEFGAWYVLLQERAKEKWLKTRLYGKLRKICFVFFISDVNMAFQHAARNVLFEDESVIQKLHLMVNLPTSARKKGSLSASPKSHSKGMHKKSLGTHI